MSSLIRIFSDIHCGHRASLAKDPSQIAPLAEGADALIFNGDTVETKYADSPEHAISKLPTLEAFRAEVASWGVQACFITGNHDPDATDLHWLTIGNGETLVTHGDATFRNIAPWSCQAPELEAALERHAQILEISGIDDYLATVKRAIVEAHLAVPEYDPTVWGKLQMLLRQAWPPNKPFKIMSAWRQAARNAIRFADRFELKPSNIIIGHTHRPGVRTIGDRTVVNTGSFFFWPGAYCVDLRDRELVVRRIRKSSRGFALGDVVARKPLRNRALIDAETNPPAPESAETVVPGRSALR